MSRIPFHEEGNDEAKAVDSLLSKALFRLSINERNAMEEEIHGVRCLAPEETPQLLQSSLQTLSMVLANDAIIPVDKKIDYLRSQQLPSTYINSDEFGLRFLRLFLFDVVEAAKHIVRFIEIGVVFFGDVILERPVRLQDLSKKELQLLRSGSLQLSPFRDRGGRRIVFVLNPHYFSAAENANYSQLSPQDQVNTMKISTPRISTYISDQTFQSQIFVILSVFLISNRNKVRYGWERGFFITCLGLLVKILRRSARGLC